MELKGNQKKIIVLNTDPKDFSYGGVCPFIRNMHPYLSEKFDIDYITLPNKWRKVPGSTRVKYLFYLFLYRNKLKKADFVLSHGPEASYIASYSGVPYSHIYHGNSNPMTISRYKIGKYFAKIWDKMFNRIEETCPLIYTVGPARKGNHKKLYNPLNQNFLPIPTDIRKGFIFAGRLEAMKNIDRLIKIYSKLPQYIKKENPFYIAGYGTQEDKLKELVEQLNLSEQVIFLGKIDNTEMLKTDADKRILLMASSTEGMPTAIAEAFSVGVPVVSTAVGDIPNVVKNGENGRLLPLEYSDEEYISCITDIIDNYDRYSDVAYKTSEIFNAEKITNGVIEDILSILENNETN